MFCLLQLFVFVTARRSRGFESHLDLNKFATYQMCLSGFIYQGIIKFPAHRCIRAWILIYQL